MRTSFYFLLMFFIFSFVKADAQYQSIFHGDSASWKIRSLYSTSAAFYYTDSLYINGDTLIQGNTFKKIRTFDWNQMTYDFLLLREDTISGKVWAKITYKGGFNNNDTNIRLLADYSLNIGDSFLIESNKYYVDSVYFILGKKHLRLTYQHNTFFPGNCGSNLYSPLIFIEGIGTNYGIYCHDMVINYNLFQHQVEQPYLVCAYEGMKNIYFDTILFNSCSPPSCTASSSILEYNKGMISVFPNPSKDKIYLRKDNSDLFSSYTTYKIYNLCMEEIEAGTLKSDEITISTLNKGVYFLILENNQNQIITAKFLKQ